MSNYKYDRSLNAEYTTVMRRSSVTSEELPILTASKLPHFPTPRDRFHAVYLIFFLLGVGSLLPWNFFITAKTYFQYKMRNVTHPSEQTSMQQMFENYLILASTVPNVIFQFINVVLTKSVSQKVRMSSSCIVMILIFILTDALAIVNTDAWQTTFFALTMFIVVVSNSGQSLYCGALIGVVSMFPPKYIACAMAGQAFGGTISALAFIFSLAGSSNVQSSAVSFFISATLIIALCFVGYIMLFYIKFSKYYMERHCQAIESDAPGQGEGDGPVDEVDIAITIDKDNVASIWEVIKMIAPFVISIFITFTVTLSLFPAVAGLIESVDKRNGAPITNKFFSPVVCFLLFNVGDFVGRSITSTLRCIKSYNTRLMVLLSVLRLAFIPLIVYCNLENNRLTVVFDNDAYPVVFLCLIGVSNGYLSTLCVMYAPERVPLRWAELSGGIMSFCMSLGLALGSSVSLGLVKLVIEQKT